MSDPDGVEDIVKGIQTFEKVHFQLIFVKEVDINNLVNDSSFLNIPLLGSYFISCYN